MVRFWAAFGILVRHQNALADQLKNHPEIIIHLRITKGRNKEPVERDSLSRKSN